MRKEFEALWKHTKKDQSQLSLPILTLEVAINTEYETRAQVRNNSNWLNI